MAGGGVHPALRLMLSVMLDHFGDDEIQELLGEFGIQRSPVREVFEPCDLGRFAGRIGRGKVIFGFQFAHGLRVLETFAKRVHKDGIQAVNAFTMLFEHGSGAGYGIISQRASPWV